jgi:hypothetical protein
MNSPNPYSEDELDRLVRGTLNAWVGTQEPPEHIWKQIRVKLETGESSPHRFPTLVVQSALPLLLVIILVGAGLQMQLTRSGDSARILSFGLPSSVATVYVDERSVSPGVMHLSNESDVGSLRTFSQLDAAQQITVEPESHPPGLAPLNVAPHPMGAERRYESDDALSLRILLTTDVSTELAEVGRSLKESTTHIVDGGQPSAHSPLWGRDSSQVLWGMP